MAVSGKSALMLFLCVMVANAVEGAMNCPMVVTSLTPCLSYLTKGGPVPSACCTGITSLYNVAYAPASTTNDRQIACQCLEKTAGMIPGLNLDNAGSLPGKCGVKIPYKISPDTDCSIVQ